MVLSEGSDKGKVLWVGCMKVWERMLVCRSVCIELKHVHVQV